MQEHLLKAEEVGMAKIVMPRKIRKTHKIKIIRVELEIEFIKPIIGRILILFFGLLGIRVIKAEIYGQKIYLICIPKFYYAK